MIVFSGSRELYLFFLVKSVLVQEPASSHVTDLKDDHLIHASLDDQHKDTNNL